MSDETKGPRNNSGVTPCPSPSCGNTERFPLTDIHGQFINRVRCHPCGREEWAIRLYDSDEWYTPLDVAAIAPAARRACAEELEALVRRAGDGLEEDTGLVSTVLCLAMAARWRGEG